MAASQDCVYAHKDAVIHIEQFRTMAKISFGLAIQFRRDQETGHTLGRFPAFPAQVGAGKTIDEALGSLQKVYRAFIETFLTKNGLTAFKTRLLETGFRRIDSEDDVLDSPDAQQWEPWMIQGNLVPSIEMQLQ